MAFCRYVLQSTVEPLMFPFLRTSFTLMRTETSARGYIGTQKYRLADGSVVDSDRFSYP